MRREIEQLKICKNCHWLKDNEPFKVLSNGRYYPCTNIGVDGWDYWDEHQMEPEFCEDYCKRGEYVPTGIWAGVAELVKEVAEIASEDKNEESEEK